MSDQAYGVSKSVFKPPPVKPCPTCYQPLVNVDGRWICARHGDQGLAK